MLYASQLNIEIASAKLNVEGQWSVSGSVFQQTRVTKMVKLETKLDIESDADPELLAAVCRNASNACHAEVAFREPVPVIENTVVNGKPFDLKDYPAKTVRRAR